MELLASAPVASMSHQQRPSDFHCLNAKNNRLPPLTLIAPWRALPLAALIQTHGPLCMKMCVSGRHWVQQRVSRNNAVLGMPCSLTSFSFSH